MLTDLNLTRVFVAIYEAGSLTAAGRRLFVTQSAISQSLARLRRELGDPLFEASADALRLTVTLPRAASRFVTTTKRRLVRAKGLRTRRHAPASYPRKCLQPRCQW